MNEHAEEDVTAHFPPPECAVVLTVDPMDQTTSLPPYVVTAISMADYLVNAAPSLPCVHVVPLNILDFGNGMPVFIIFSWRIHNITQIFRKGDVRPPMHCAVGVRSPEVVFSMVALGNNDPDWDMRSDIWSLGCAVSLFNFYLGYA